MYIIGNGRTIWLAFKHGFLHHQRGFYEKSVIDRFGSRYGAIKKRKAFSFSPLSMMVAVSFCRYSFSGWINSLLFPIYWEFFQEWMLNFVRCFLCIYWDCSFFLFKLINIAVYIHWFSCVRPTMHIWINPSGHRRLSFLYIVRSSLLNFV